MWATVHGLASLHLHGALVATTGQPDVDVLVDIATDLHDPYRPDANPIEHNEGASTMTVTDVVTSPYLTGNFAPGPRGGRRGGPPRHR